MPAKTADVSDNIITQLGIESLPDETKAKLLDDMADLVLKRTVIRLMESMDPGQTRAAVAEAKDPSQLIALMGKNFDMSQLIAEEVEQAKNEIALLVSESAE